MVPLDPATSPEVTLRPGLPTGPGLLALRHALRFRRPGLWGDSSRSPRSIILIREGGSGQLEAFGAGQPEPAVGWLVEHRRAFTLLAPGSWFDAVCDRPGEIVEDVVETWTCEDWPEARRGAARRLTLDDADGFDRLAPAWALRGWGSFSALIEHGAAFGVPDGPGFASLAWVFDQAVEEKGR